MTGPSRRSVLAGAAALAACQPASTPQSVLRVGLPTGADSLDPFVGQFAAAAIIYRQIHAPLAGYRDDHALTGRWESEAGFMRWTAHLRPGLKWSNGEPLTASDILWSLRRGANPETAGPDVGDLSIIRGALEIVRGQSAPEALGVRVLDGRTLEFTLTRPHADFPDAMREFYPINPRAVETHGPDWTRPENFVCSGPYVPVAESQLSLTLKKNPNHHRADAVSIPEIEMSVVEDAGARVRLFRAGDLDLALDPPANRLEELRGLLGDQARTYDAPRLVYLKVNHDREPLADPRIRRALHISIDREFIAGQIIGGSAEPAFTAVPGVAESLSATPHETRMETAARLVREAGYGPDNPLTLGLLHSGEERARVAVALADDWARIGINAEIQASESTGLYAMVGEGRFDLALARFDRGMRSANWRYLEPFAPGGFAANFGWEDPALAALIEDIQAEGDPERRDALVARAEGLMMDQANLIPLMRENAIWLIASRIEGADDEQPVFWGDLALSAPAG